MNRKARRESQRRWEMLHRAQVLKYRKSPKAKELNNARNRRWWRKRRELALEIYGEHRCACCGEPRFEFLGFDHIKGNGGKHRKSFNSGGGFIKWLLDEYREDIRVLCHNCNFSIGHYGHCPHRVERGETELAKEN